MIELELALTSLLLRLLFALSLLETIRNCFLYEDDIGGDHMRIHKAKKKRLEMSGVNINIFMI